MTSPGALSIMLDVCGQVAIDDRDPELAARVYRGQYKLEFKKVSPMFQVPTNVWNQIAATGMLKHPFYSKIMYLNFDGIDKALDNLTEKLQSAGTPNSVIVAYMYLAPLLAENKAISEFIDKSVQHQLRSALPEVLSPNEALILAKKDYYLTEKEQSILLGLFQAVLVESLSDWMKGRFRGIPYLYSSRHINCPGYWWFSIIYTVACDRIVIVFDNLYCFFCYSNYHCCMVAVSSWVCSELDFKVAWL